MMMYDVPMILITLLIDGDIAMTMLVMTTINMIIMMMVMLIDDNYLIFCKILDPRTFAQGVTC